MATGQVQINCEHFRHMSLNGTQMYMCGHLNSPINDLSQYCLGDKCPILKHEPTVKEALT